SRTVPVPPDGAGGPSGRDRGVPARKRQRLTMAKILVVDDRAANRDFLVTLLGYRGHDLLEAGDGAEALAMAKSNHPDLVIADILMPTMDGYEFVRHLRADADVANTAVVFW